MEGETIKGPRDRNKIKGNVKSPVKLKTSPIKYWRDGSRGAAAEKSLSVYIEVVPPYIRNFPLRIFVDGAGSLIEF